MRLGAAIIAALSLTAHASSRQRLPRYDDTEISCGLTEYTPDEVQSAVDAACQYMEDGTTAGSSSYPHTYRDEEGFNFNGVEGPYVEFPIKPSGVYEGGKPGADRVIINEDCRLAGVITHNGANGEAFVGCDGTS